MAYCQATPWRLTDLGEALDAPGRSRVRQYAIPSKICLGLARQCRTADGDIRAEIPRPTLLLAKRTSRQA